MRRAANRQRYPACTGLPERPPVKLEDIPAGARFTDPEIAAKIAADTSLGLVSCSQIMGQSIREDIGALFAKYHLAKTAQGVRILQMNKEKAGSFRLPSNQETRLNMAFKHENTPS